MERLSDILVDCRKQRKLKLREVSAHTGIDQGLISKYEQGRRIPTDEHTLILEGYYALGSGALKHLQLAEKVYQVLEGEAYASQALIAAESRLEYLAQARQEAKFAYSDVVKDALATLDHLKAQYDALPKVSTLHSNKIEDHFSLKYTYESNKIEGNTLTLSETMMVIKEGITISGKSVNEHLEALNHNEAIELLHDFVRRTVDLTQSVVLNFHGLILRGIDRRNAGRYRQVNVRILGAAHIPPEPYLVPKYMEDYFVFYEQHKQGIHPVLLAAEMHERLVTIHPFIDGNGRTSRLIMNLILLMHGYPIAILKGDQASRLAYFAALESVQIDGDAEPFHLLVIDRLIEAYKERIALSTPIDD